MASSAKARNPVVEESGFKLLYGDDPRFRYWESHLFNETYLRRDLPEKHSVKWENTEFDGFRHFLTTIRDLAQEYKDRSKELENWSETETINSWVKHVLDGLGWKDNCTGVQNPFLEETSFRYEGKTLRTDILIVDLPKEKQYINQAEGDKKLVEARNAVIVPVEVKYWQRLEEFRQGRKEESKKRDNGTDDIERMLTPNEQTIQYLKMLKKDWGILTDGAKWRLFNIDLSSEDPNRYYEFNLFSLVESINTEENESDRKEVVEAAKYFYHFFSKDALYQREEGEESFVGEVLRYSKKYVDKVEEDLKQRFLKAMNVACNGFSNLASEHGLKTSLETIRSVAESTLFNLLFIKSLESRGVLPMSSTDYKKISLSNLVDKIERFDSEKEEVINNRELERAFKKGNGNAFNYTPEGSEIHDRILRLTNVLHEGSSASDSFGFEITGFKESVFGSGELSIFKKCKLANSDWVKILFQLGYASSESLNRKYQQIPYSYFTPRQLGSIYESFLEFTLDEAKFDMIYEEKQWIKADLESKKYRESELPKARAGELFFTPNNADRKASGSYYTPDYIAVDLMKHTMDAMIRGRTSAQIAEISVCDPAMGSGHFLAGSLNYLTSAYLTALDKETRGDLDVDLRKVKMQILSKCVFGVDVTPNAVKLGKLSLWLETACVGSKLIDLKNQLVEGNSLETPLKKIYPDRKGFNVVIGNPPWGGTLFDIEEVDSDVQDSVAEKNINTFELFLRTTKEWCTAEGRLGFIIPRNFIRKKQYSMLRKDLLPQISYVGDLGKFPGVVQEACALVVDSHPCDSFVFDDSIKVALKDPNAVGTQNVIEKSKIKAPEYVIQPGKSDTLDEIAAIVSQHPKFSSYFSFGRGIEVGKTGEMAKCPKCESLTPPPKKKNKKGTFEKDCPECGTKITLKTERISVISDKAISGYVPIIAGPDVEPFKFKVKRFIKSGLKEVNYRPKLFKSKKRIYIPMNNDKIVAAYDRDGKCFALKTVYVATATDSAVDLDAVTSALNSEIVNFYFEYCINNGAELTNSISTENLGSLPIPDALAKKKNVDLCRAYGISDQHMETIRNFLNSRNKTTKKKQPAA